MSDYEQQVHLCRASIAKGTEKEDIVPVDPAQSKNRSSPFDVLAEDIEVVLDVFFGVRRWGKGGLKQPLTRHWTEV